MEYSITRNQLLGGLAELDRLASLDYGESIWAVASASQDDFDVKLLRLGRLLGVSMKEPFSTSRKRPRSTRDTRSTRAWTLRAAYALEETEVRQTWQYQTLKAMAKEAKVTPYEMALHLKRERHFFGYLYRSVHNYICADPKIREKVKKNVEAAHKGGLNLCVKSPETVVSAGGLALGSYLISVAPSILGYVGAPVIAGLVLLLYTIGVDAFCQWAKDKALDPGLTKPSTRTTRKRVAG
jgi:hypothetical protein